ncbi:hypothetical protein [Glaciecola sp. SC05]|uniref:hypothetical protein n=1 Tax=Glaciecola sp. SC05 TaxID=1987355 RepID=UPI003527DC43
MLIQVMCNKLDQVTAYIDDESIHFVLLQNGVYLLPRLLTLVSPHRIKVLDVDWRAAGLDAQFNDHPAINNKHVNYISHTQWVVLCAEHTPVMTLQ